VNERLIKLAERIKASLREPHEKWWFARAKEADTQRKKAIKLARETDANAAWFLRAVATGRGDFARAFRLMREEKYQDAWNLLEQIEISCMNVLANPILEPDSYAVPELQAAIARWQTLYPYAVFASPEWITKRVECSICGKDIDPWEGCGHQTGKVYMGEIAYRIIREAQFLAIALVRDPVQKYSVILVPGVEPNYTRVRYVVERLSHAFARWDIKRAQAYHAHALFEDICEDGDCPCHSGRSYGGCCLKLPGVVLPHDQIFFDEPIPDHLPRFILQRPSKPPGSAVGATNS
jgi:hypothetical protein